VAPTRGCGCRRGSAVGREADLTCTARMSVIPPLQNRTLCLIDFAPLADASSLFRTASWFLAGRREDCPPAVEGLGGGLHPRLGRRRPKSATICPIEIREIAEAGIERDRADRPICEMRIGERPMRFGKTPSQHVFGKSDAVVFKKLLDVTGRHAVAQGDGADSQFEVVEAGGDIRLDRLQVLPRARRVAPEAPLRLDARPYSARSDRKYVAPPPC
jgi:hypothetical protein